MNQKESLGKIFYYPDTQCFMHNFEGFLNVYYMRSVIKRQTNQTASGYYE